MWSPCTHTKMEVKEKEIHNLQVKTYSVHMRAVFHCLSKILNMKVLTVDISHLTFGSLPYLIVTQDSLADTQENDRFPVKHNVHTVSVPYF